MPDSCWLVARSGTFATGLLAGGYTFVYGEAPAEMVAKRDQWSELCASFSVALPAVAMAFSALPAVVAKVVVGCSSQSDVEDCASHCQGTAVPKELWVEAQALGLLPDWMRFT